MESSTWIFLVIMIAILAVFIILPSVRTNTPVPTYVVSAKPSEEKDGPCQNEADKERCLDREMLKSYYPPPLSPEVPVDYPRKAIGACPYSKAQSQSLPFTDMPMYML